MSPRETNAESTASSWSGFSTARDVDNNNTPRPTAGDYPIILPGMQSHYQPVNFYMPQQQLQQLPIDPILLYAPSTAALQTIVQQNPPSETRLSRQPETSPAEAMRRTGSPSMAGHLDYHNTFRPGDGTRHGLLQLEGSRADIHGFHNHPQHRVQFNWLSRTVQGRPSQGAIDFIYNQAAAQPGVQMHSAGPSAYPDPRLYQINGPPPNYMPDLAQNLAYYSSAPVGCGPQYPSPPMYSQDEERHPYIPQPSVATRPNPPGRKAKACPQSQQPETRPPQEGDSENDVTEDKQPGKKKGDTNVPTWRGYPRPYEALDEKLSLYEIANRHPNQLRLDNLNDFIRARWSASEIQWSMPSHCQDDLNKRPCIDKAMWIQKRLEKQEKQLQTTGQWKALWENPQQRGDGRPDDAPTGNSLKRPNQRWLAKRCLAIINETQAVTSKSVDRNSTWREPAGASLFQLNPSWTPPAATVSTMRNRRTTTSMLDDDADGDVADNKESRRRTAPPGGALVDENFNAEADADNDSARPFRHRQSSLAALGFRSDDDVEDRDTDEAARKKPESVHRKPQRKSDQRRSMLIHDDLGSPVRTPQLSCSTLQPVNANAGTPGPEQHEKVADDDGEGDATTIATPAPSGTIDLEDPNQDTN